MAESGLMHFSHSVCYPTVCTACRLEFEVSVIIFSYLFLMLCIVLCFVSFFLSFCVLHAQDQWNCWELWRTVLPNSSLPAYPILCQNLRKCSQILMSRCRMRVSKRSGRLGPSSGIQRSWVRTACVPNAKG